MTSEARERTFKTRIEYYREFLGPLLEGRTHVTPEEVFAFSGGRPEDYTAKQAEGVCAVLAGLGARPMANNTWAVPAERKEP